MPSSSSRTRSALSPRRSSASPWPTRRATPRWSHTAPARPRTAPSPTLPWPPPPHRSRPDRCRARIASPSTTSCCASRPSWARYVTQGGMRFRLASELDSYPAPTRQHCQVEQTGGEQCEGARLRRPDRARGGVIDLKQVEALAVVAEGDARDRCVGNETDEAGIESRIRRCAQLETVSGAQSDRERRSAAIGEIPVHEADRPRAGRG